MSPSEQELANAVWDAKTPEDVKRILTLARAVYGELKWRAVGDRPNNHGNIRMGSDPGLALVERITNGIDAVVSLRARTDGSPTKPRDPREAGRLWFGVPTSGFNELTAEERRKLGLNVRVRLDESGEGRRPTIVIQDWGEGQTPKQFPKTLVSLNESNKADQPWTMGTYGQGGSVALGFCKATLIISKRSPTIENANVGWTLITEHPAGENGQKLPNYQFLVTSSGEVPELRPELLGDLQHGTKVVHVAYDLQRLTGPVTTQMWQFLHSALFDPVLPFELSGTRKNDPANNTRIIVGNRARLERPELARGDLELAHRDSYAHDLGGEVGSVEINYWCVRRPLDSASTSEPLDSYCNADTAISITLFGQRQDNRQRAWLKDRIKLPFLYKRLIVQVSCDGLKPAAKGELFTSTRERATESDLKEKVYYELERILLNDEELKRLNHEEKERMLSQSTAKVSEKVQKRLGEFIKTVLKDVQRPGGGSAEEGDEGTKKPRPGKPSPPRNTDDTNLHGFPTMLKFEKDELTAVQGAGSHVWLLVDAKNGFFPQHEGELVVQWSGPSTEHLPRVSSRSELLGGKSRWLMATEGSTPLGDYRLEARMMTPNGPLATALVLHVVAPPPAKPKTKSTEPATGPKIQWVFKEQWDAHDMNENIVGKVTEDDETIIWVNRHLKSLERALAGRSLTEEAIETRASRYLYPVACALWLQSHEVKSMEEKPNEVWLQRELARMAEAVLLAIDPDVDLAMELSAES